VAEPVKSLRSGAVVQAGAAADALQGLAQLGVVEHGRAAVVQNDQVNFVGAVLFARPPGRGDHIEVGGDQLPGGRTGQKPQKRRDLLQFLHDFLEPHHGDVHGWHGGAHAPVALVFHQAQGAGFGHGEVDAAQAHLALEVLPPQPRAGDRGEFVHVLGVGRVRNHLMEDLGDLVFVLVHGRHDDVRGGLAGQLDNIFAQVGFHDFQALVLQKMI
jgi:hypothetical protein